MMPSFISGRVPGGLALAALLVGTVPSPSLAQGSAPRGPAGVARVELERIVRERGLDPEEVTRPLRITPEIAAWATARVPSTADEVIRLGRLLDALQGSKDPLFRYRAGHTGTAAEVFETGDYNCLSFSLLFVSLARHLGLRAYFLKIDRDQEFEKVGDLVVVSRHITAGYGFVGDRTVLEFDVGPQINYQLGEPVGDLEALTLYYSNRGAELLREGDPAAALEMLQTAVTLMPELAQPWVNLGVVRRRLGDYRGAEEAYLESVDLDRDNLPAYQNLLTLQRLQGEPDVARELIHALDRRRNRNPFTYLWLGDLSLEEGRLDEAKRFYRRALRLARYEAETRAAMGIWALSAGDRDKASSWLERAAELDGDNPRVRELERRLAGAEGRLSTAGVRAEAGDEPVDPGGNPP